MRWKLDCYSRSSGAEIVHHEFNTSPKVSKRVHAETSDCGRAVSPCELLQEVLVDVRLEIHVTALQMITCITLCKIFPAFN